MSIITRLSVKAIRHYQTLGLLIPSYIDEENGYHYYNETAVTKAFSITQLRNLGFSLEQIKSILKNCTDDRDLIQYLAGQKNLLSEMIVETKNKVKDIEYMMKNIGENMNPPKSKDSEVLQTVYIKDIDTFIFAGFKMKGRYEEVGQAFAKVAQVAKRHLIKPALTLFFDSEYKEVNASFSGGFQVTKGIKIAEIDCQKLPAIKAICIRHFGSYTTLGSSYKAIFNFIEKEKLETELPYRELYHKGPGMFFRGNPEKYITEIQIPIKDRNSK